MNNHILKIVMLLLMTISLVGCQKSVSKDSSATDIQSSTVVTTSPTTETKNTTILPTTEEPTTEKPTEELTELPTESAEKELFNGNNIRITYIGFDSTSRISKKVKLRVENNSVKDYTVQVRDVSVNGFMMDPICSFDVLSGKIANDDITFWNSDFKENGIEKIEHIEFKFHIYNTYRDYFDTDTISIDFYSWWRYNYVKHQRLCNTCL